MAIHINSATQNAFMNRGPAGSAYITKRGGEYDRGGIGGGRGGVGTG